MVSDYFKLLPISKLFYEEADS